MSFGNTRKLRAAFEHTVSATGTTFIHFSHPKAPSLLMTRNPLSQPQVVPVLLAGTASGGEGINPLLGIELSKAGNDWMPLFQGITDGEGFFCVMVPFLFYRAPSTGNFPTAAQAACDEVGESGLLVSWCFVRCGVSYQTKDGQLHQSKDYPEALGAEVEEAQPWEN